MIECVSVENMRNSDRQTIEGGIGGRELILRAATAVFQAVDWRGKIANVLCEQLNCSEKNVIIRKNGICYHKRPVWISL